LASRTVHGQFVSMVSAMSGPAASRAALTALGVTSWSFT
jgi:hypothetical protein